MTVEEFIKYSTELSNVDLLEEVISSAGGDDYDGTFTKRGLREFAILEKELRKRLANWLDDSGNNVEEKKMEASNIKTSVEKCDCGEKATKLHPCPYKEDVGGDSETLCNCCTSCEKSCCEDI
jgi:hypothetical protein